MKQPWYLVKYVLREIWHRKKFNSFFIFNFSLGLISLVFISVFIFSTNRFLELNLRQTFSADLEIQSIVPISKENLLLAKNVLGNPSTSKLVSINTMARVGSFETTRNILSQIIAIESNYPLVGSLTLQKNTKADLKSHGELATKDGAWIAPELADSLSLKIGDYFKVGSLEIEVLDILTQSPLAAVFSFTPKIYVSPATLEKTGLVQITTRTSFTYKFLLKDYQLASVYKTSLDESFAGSASSRGKINVRTYHNSSNSLTRLIDTVSNYLALMSLMGFMIASFGSIYLYRHYFNKKKHDFAVLRVLGVSQKAITASFIFQMFLISTLATILTLAVAQMGLYVLNKAGGAFLVDGFSFSLDGLTILKVVIVTFLGIPSFCWPLLVDLNNYKLSNLFEEIPKANSGSLSHKLASKNKASKGSRILNFIYRRKIIHYLPLFLFFLAVALLITPNIEMLFFFSGLVGLFLIFGSIGFIVLKLAEGVQTKIYLPPLVKGALRLVTRYKESSLQYIMALGIVSFLFFLIPQLHTGIVEQISFSNKSEAPQFFLFDIQPDQIEDLKEFSSQNEVQLKNLSPLVRSHLVAVNDIDYASWRAENKTSLWGQIFGESEKQKEESMDSSRQRRGYNLTYKESFNASEQITKGPADISPEIGQNEALPKISLETEFADRYDFELGDKLTFDIEGEEVSGKVYNIRKIRWDQFLPNFFLVFQPEVLEEYPAVYLANFSGLQEGGSADLIYKMSLEFPNIAVLDIRQIAKKLIAISYDILNILLVLIAIALVTGLIGLYGIMIAEFDRNLLINNLYRILGLSYNKLLVLSVLQYFTLTSLALLISVLLSYATYYLVGWLLFDVVWTYDYTVAIISFVGFNILLTLWLLLSNVKLFLSSPAKIFSDS